jgi:hypothetical protein
MARFANHTPLAAWSPAILILYPAIFRLRFGVSRSLMLAGLQIGY